jgi:hypothetical protein
MCRSYGATQCKNTYGSANDLSLLRSFMNSEYIYSLNLVGVFTNKHQCCSAYRHSSISISQFPADDSRRGLCGSVQPPLLVFSPTNINAFPRIGTHLYQYLSSPQMTPEGVSAVRSNRPCWCFHQQASMPFPRIVTRAYYSVFNYSKQICFTYSE